MKNKKVQISEFGSFQWWGFP